MEGFLTREWGLLSSSGGWLVEHHPISDQPMGVALFHTVQGGVDLRDRHFFVPGWSELVVDLCMQV